MPTNLFFFWVATLFNNSYSASFYPLPPHSRLICCGTSSGLWPAGSADSSGPQPLIRRSRGARTHRAVFLHFHSGSMFPFAVFRCNYPHMLAKQCHQRKGLFRLPLLQSQGRMLTWTRSKELLCFLCSSEWRICIAESPLSCDRVFGQTKPLPFKADCF